jgi:hypothetical protein
VVSEEAESLAQFLLKPGQYPYKAGQSPLVQVLESKIKQITSEIADQVIAETPDLRAVIRRKTEAAVKQTLLDDGYLNRIITESIARAITQRALESEDD